MANEKISAYSVSVAELEDTDLIDVSKDIGGGDFESQKMTGAILRNFFKAGSKAITTAETQVTFSSSLPNTNYQINIIDNNGVGHEAPYDLQITGFKIKGLTAGTIGYIAILNN